LKTSGGKATVGRCLADAWCRIEGKTGNPNGAIRELIAKGCPLVRTTGARAWAFARRDARKRCREIAVRGIAGVPAENVMGGWNR